MILGYLLAVLATVASGSGSVFESLAVRRAGAFGGRSKELWQLLRQPMYFLGLGIDIVGFGMAAAALHLLPLFLVQSLMAFSIGVTAVICGLLGATISGRTWLMLGCGAVGLVLLGLSADPGPARPLDLVWRIALCGVPLVCAALDLLALRLANRWTPAVLALASGIGFSTAGVAARTFVVPQPLWHVLFEPSLLAIAANGLAAAVSFALALQRSAATAVTAVMFITNTSLSAAIGLLYLDDRVRDGFLPVASFGFVVAVLAAVGTAHYSASAQAHLSAAEVSADEPDPVPN